MSITKEEVRAAAAKLGEARRKITVSAVREVLGNRGSFTTIANHLKEWRSLHDESKRQDVLNEDSIPTPIKELGGQVVRLVWRTASEWAEREINTTRKVAEARFLESNEELIEAMEQIVELEEKVVSLEGAALLEKQNSSQIKAELKESNLSLKEVKERLQEAESLVTSLQSKNSHNQILLDNLQAQLTKSERTLEEERARSRELENRERDTLMKLTDEIRISAPLRERLSRVEQDLAKVSVEKDTLLARLKEQNDKNLEDKKLTINKSFGSGY
jgi:chromosome segregation ATPase